MWLEILKKQVEETSLGTVAEEMGVSKAMISLVVNDKYNGNMQNVQSLVESVYMGHTVTCPVLGVLPHHKCAEHQGRTHISSTPQAIQLWKSCRSGCPHSQLTKRLNTPVKLRIEPPNKGAPMNTDRAYDARAACSRLERQAKTDSNNGDNFHRIYIELLKRELIALGSRFNRIKNERRELENK